MIIFRIKEIREKKNISQNKLSQISGVSRAYLYNIENNLKTNISLEILFKISKALDVNVKELFYTTFDIEDLKQEMYQCIADTSINSKEVLEISQLIDLLINIKMKEELN